MPVPVAAPRLQPEQLAEGQAVADREAEGADERLVAGAEEVPLDHLAAQRVGAVEHPDLAAGGHRRLGGPDGGGGVGVVARADVLEVDQQQVEPGEGRRGRAQRVLDVAVEREDGQRRSTDRARPRRGSCPARCRSSRARGRRGRAAGPAAVAARARWMGRPSRGDRGAVGEDAVAPAREAARGRRGGGRGRSWTLTSPVLPAPEDARPAAALGLQPEVGDHRALLHRLDHVVEGEGRGRAGEQGFHLGAGAGVDRRPGCGSRTPSGIGWMSISTWSSGSGCASGISSAVRLAPWMPARRATAKASPLGRLASRIRVWAESSTRQEASATRRVTAFSETSTMWALPWGSR